MLMNCYSTNLRSVNWQCTISKQEYCKELGKCLSTDKCNLNQNLGSGFPDSCPEGFTKCSGNSGCWKIKCPDIRDGQRHFRWHQQLHPDGQVCLVRRGQRDVLLAAFQHERRPRLHPEAPAKGQRQVDRLLPRSDEAEAAADLFAPARSPLHQQGQGREGSILWTGLLDLFYEIFCYC